MNVIITISGTTKVWFPNLLIVTLATSQANSPSNLANWNPQPKWEQELEERYVRINETIKRKKIVH